MPPKKKFRDTRANTEIFLLGQPSSTPATMTKPLTNADMVKYIHHRKELEGNKYASCVNLFCCSMMSGTAEASCHLKGCQSKGGDDLCGVSFAKYTGGWLKTGIPLKSDKSIKHQIMKTFKDWQSINKLSSRLSKSNLSSKQQEVVNTFKTKMNNTFIICDDNAEDMIAKDRLRDDQQKMEDIAFLKSMKEDRIATLSSKDIVYQDRIDNKLQRLEDLERRD